MAMLLGLKLLRVAPLVSATAGVMCAWDQQFAFQSFIDRDVPQEPAGIVIPRFFPAIFRPLIWVVSIIHPLGGLLGLVNGVGAAGAALDSQTRWCYLAGGAFAMGHLAYGRRAMGIIGVIWDQSLTGRANLDALRPWLQLNLCRIMTNNVPAFCFFLAAVVGAIQVREA